MNEEDRKRLIKQIERELLFAHLNGMLPPNFNKTLMILESMNINPDVLLDNAFYKFDLLSILCESGEADPIAANKIDFANFCTFDFFTFEKIGNVSERGLIPFTVIGDSMVGVGIEDGDIVLAQSEAFVSGAVYVVKFQDMYFVKRVEKTSNGFLLVSENPKYQRVEIQDDFDLEIVGKVKYVMKSVE
ncbi:MAG: S24 family peptidase [Ignavibacteria bacterium]|nr:S24 family peptidase [Ignavibacteria bacterium]